MASIFIENLTGGWGLNYSSSSSNAIQAKTNQYTKSTAISFWRPGFLGQMAPGETLTALADAGGRVTALPLNGDTDSSGNYWIVLKNGRLVKVASDSVSANYDPTGATSTEFSDMNMYKSGANEYAIWSWDSGTTADVARIKIDGSGQTDGWFSALTGSGTLTTGVPHMITQGTISNDIYITNGQYVANVDIAAGKGNTQALNLGEGWIGKSICNHGNYVAILGNRNTVSTSDSKGKCRVWLWDGFSPDPNFIYDIQDNTATAIFDDAGILKAFTQGRNSQTLISYLSGGKFKRINSSKQIGNAPRHGSVEYFEDKIHWGAKSGQVINLLDGDAIHSRQVLYDGTNTGADVGMVKNLSSTLLYYGVDIGGSSYKIYKTNYSGYYTSSSLITRLFELPYSSKITKIIVYFSQFGSGASVTLSLYKDYDTSSDILAQTITNASLGAVSSSSVLKLLTSTTGDSGINAFYMKIAFNHASVSNTAAIIRRIEVQYDPYNPPY